MTRRIARTLRGVWESGLGGALYATGVACAMLQLSGLWDSRGSVFITLASVHSGTWGMMILDRAKCRDRQLDPADLDAAPERSRFVHANRGALRLAALALLLTGSALGWKAAGVIGAASVLAGAAAILAYAGRPAGAPSVFGRLKDLPVVKNLFVGFGLVALPVCLSLGAAPEPSLWLAHAPLLLALVTLVAADAMLCDVPDAPTDRQHGTRTIPAMIGARWGRVAGASLALLASGAIYASAREGPALLWSLGLGAGALIGALAPGAWVKAIVDARAPIVGALGLLLSAV